jgi:PAS domain S-box-containing protein
LGKIILGPLLQLRTSLVEAGEDPANPENYTLNLERGDEFGDVVDRFNNLLHLISQSHRSTLAQQAKLLQTTFDNIGHALAIYDAETRLIGYNKQFEDHFGFPPGFLYIGITMEDISRQRAKQGHFGNDDIEEVIAGRVRRTMNLTQERKVEHTLPNGKISISHHKPMPDGGVVTSYTDITDRKQAEQELAEKSALLEATFTNMSQGFAVYDAEMRLLAFNNRLLELRDYPPDRIHVRMKYEDLIRFNGEQDGLTRAQVGERVHDRIKGVHQGEKYEREIALPNGKVIVVHRNPMPNGGFVTTYTDITERRHADALSQRLGRILDNSFNEIYVFDAETYCFSQVNQGALSNLGYVQQEINQLTPWDIKPEFNEKSFKAALEPLVRGEKDLLVFETEHQRKNGSTYPVEVRLQLYSTEVPPVFVAIIADISDRKQAEKIIKDAKEQAEFASRSKSEFLSNMSHELRTPLNAVIGFSEMMMKENLGPLGNQQYQEYVADINSSGLHLLGLINDILDLSKVEAGKTELHEEEVDPVDVVHSCLSMVRGQARSQDLELVMDVADRLPWLRADQRVLKQIIINLLSNAVKFTPRGGMVTLKAWCQSKSGWVFQVIDTGIGISLEDIPKVMQPFTQIDSGLSR